MAQVAQGNYWQGQDGNYYLRASGIDGVTNLGRNPSNNQNFVQYVNSGAYSQIDDPMAGSVMGASTPAPSGGGTGAARPVFDQASADATQGSINSLAGILAEALSNAERGYTNARSVMDQQEAGERKKFDESSLSNMQNYDSNLMESIRAGSRGLSGLRSALRGGGGGGNSFANQWVEDTVGDTTSGDIREGFNTFDENKRGLDSSLSTFLTNLSGKRQENEDTFENNKRAAIRDNAAQSQDLYTKLAGIYGEGGRTAERDNLVRTASGFTPTIAANSNARVSAYNTAPIQVESPNITAFEGPEKQGMTADSGRLDQGIFSLNDPRRKRESATAGA